MRLTGQEREAARLMHHLMGYASYHCSTIFGVWPSSMRRIIRNKPYPTYKNNRRAGYQKDRSEILAYIAQNGPCSRFDIELCCHQDETPVLKHLAALREAGSIERYQDSYQVVT